MAKSKPQHELLAFLVLWAIRYQRVRKLDGLHPTHFDLMKKYVARMDDFKRATMPGARPNDDRRGEPRGDATS